MKYLKHSAGVTALGVDFSAVAYELGCGLLERLASAGAERHVRALFGERETGRVTHAVRHHRRTVIIALNRGKTVAEMLHRHFTTDVTTKAWYGGGGGGGGW